MRFQFPRSHIFPGARFTMEGDGEAGEQCVLEFGDGVIVLAEAARQGEDYILTVPDYRTAKGNVVAARTWRLARRGDGSWRANST